MPIRCAEALAKRSEALPPVTGEAAYLTFPSCCRYYSSDEELARLFKSVNGLILPVTLLCPPHHGSLSRLAFPRHPWLFLQGGLTDLWLDDPYVVAASKLVAMAEEENANGRVFPVRHTCSTCKQQLTALLSACSSANNICLVCPA